MAPQNGNSKAKKPKTEDLLDSWEDDDTLSDDDKAGEGADEEQNIDQRGDEEEDKCNFSPPNGQSTASSPPSPSLPLASSSSSSSSYSSGPAFTIPYRPHFDPPTPPSHSQPSKRPEKSDATARRLIAAALGLKMPKRTPEQKAYDDAAREQERKRRDAKRTAAQKEQDDIVKARAAMWGA